MAPGFGFSPKNSEKYFLQFLLCSNMALFANDSLYPRVLCSGADPVLTQYLCQIPKKTHLRCAKFSPRCERGGCKSTIFSALRAPDGRENV